MSKKMSIILFFTLVITAFSLFPAVKAMAVDRPGECVAGGKFTMTPNPDAPGFPYFSQASEGDYPGECTNSSNETVDGWVWSYRVSVSNPKFLSKLNKAYFYIPSIPDNLIEVWRSGDRGEGGTSGWGSLNYNGVIVTTENISGTGNYVDYQFCTKEVHSFGLITATLDTGEGEYGCVATDQPTDVQGDPGGIVGPGFDLESFVAITETENIAMPGGGCLQVMRDKKTGCIKKYKYCNGNDVPATAKPNWMGSEDILKIGDPSLPLCKGGSLTTTGGSYVYWYYYPNNWYCLYVWDPTTNTYRYSPCP